MLMLTCKVNVIYKKCECGFQTVLQKKFDPLTHQKEGIIDR